MLKGARSEEQELRTEVHIRLDFTFLWLSVGGGFCTGLRLRKGRVVITARRIVPCIIRDLPIIVLNESVQLQHKEEVKQVEDDTALRAIEVVKLWKLQKGTDHDIKALDRIEREIVRYKSS